MELGRPSQSKQPSRKGKRAWRKNIDIEDINESLDSIRETERDTGVKDMGTIDSAMLFQVDTAGDEKLKTKKEREKKPLKADEILSRRSAVPALQAPHKASRKSNEGMSNKQIKKLLDRAGKSTAVTSNKVEHIGLSKAPSYDLWDDAPVVADKKSFIADMKPANSHNASARAPSTIGKDPISLALNREKIEAVAIPHEGKSYNPTIEAWQALIQQEHKLESKREDQRLVLEEERNRIQLIIANFDDNGELSDSEDEEEETAEAQELDKAGLSVNQPTRNNKKLPTQRNKEKRHLSKLKLEADLKDLKKQIRDLENIPRLLKEAERQIKETEAAVQAAVDEPFQRIKAPKLSRHHKLAELPLEIKLSDELTESLRLLKPEGNLAKERFRLLQERGLIEPRTPVAKKRKYTPKITEKWGYKDMTL